MQRSARSNLQMDSVSSRAPADRIVGRLSVESYAPTERPFRLKHSCENIGENMIEKESKSAFFSSPILQLLVIYAAGLSISGQNTSQNGGQMNSNIETNTATSANQNIANQKTTAKGEYASVNGLKMYYEIHGTGRPLVLLHGAFMSATVYPSLAEGRQVIAVDLQGHGRTADIDRPLTFDQMADDTAALLKQLKIEQTDVFGYSMGGKVGLALALKQARMKVGVAVRLRRF